MLKELITDFKKIFSELILFKELMYVAENQQKEIIWIYYNKLLKEYYKVHKRIKAIFWLYYFLYIWRKIVDYVSRWDLCHKIKLVKHKSYEEIKISLVLN